MEEERRLLVGVAPRRAERSEDPDYSVDLAPFGHASASEHPRYAFVTHRVRQIII
jgi:hypothetical protein